MYDGRNVVTQQVLNGTIVQNSRAVNDKFSDGKSLDSQQVMKETAIKDKMKNFGVTGCARDIPIVARTGGGLANVFVLRLEPNSNKDICGIIWILV